MSLFVIDCLCALGAHNQFYSIYTSKLRCKYTMLLVELDKMFYHKMNDEKIKMGKS